MNSLLCIGAMVAMLSVTEQLFDDWSLPQYGYVGLVMVFFIGLLTIMAVDFDVKDIKSHRARRGSREE